MRKGSSFWLQCFVIKNYIWDEMNAPYEQSLSFTCLNLAYSRKSLHESSKIFVEHELNINVARIQFQTQT